MRVIAGRLGGRRLVAPRGMATRPTSDRVREALFSALGDVSGAEVLDLYAGTGALGIEALSRGAARATFVESSRGALSALRENVAALGLGGVARVVAQPVERAVSVLLGPYDLIFADPPYAIIGEVPKALLALVAGGAVSDDALVILEHAKRDVAPEMAGFTLRVSKVYGDTAVSRYERAS